MSKKWYPVVERNPYLNDNERKYSISTDPSCEGWDTDMGYNGLPLNLALYICRVLNRYAKDSHFENDCGEWKMETVTHLAIDKKDRKTDKEKSVFVKVEKG